ncbi:MAG TPA: site-specific integrase [Thermoanaerobaculia bacterium]|jgi:integrase
MRGDGRVFQLRRADGSLRSSRWWIAYSVGGREIRESGGKSDAEARKVLRARLKQIAAGRWIEPEQERMTVSELLDGYEAHLSARQAKAVGSIHSHLRPVRAAFGDRRAVDLRVDDLERYRQERLASEKARQTIDHELGALRAAYSLAKKQERISRVPYFPMYRENNVRRGWIELVEAERIAAVLGEPLGTLTLFARASTWRKSEVESLTWEQVDRSAREVRLFDSKNGRGRVLPLDDYLFGLIERMWERREFQTSDGSALSPLVFHRNGTPIGDWRKTWWKACVEVGVGQYIKDEKGRIRGYQGKIFHDLRRSGIRDLVRAGVPQSVVMAISGHRTISTFLRYDIATEEDKRIALEKARAYREARPATRTVLTLDGRK